MYIGAKKRVCGRLHFFILEGQKIATGSFDPEKASLQNFADSKSRLTAKRPFVVKKWPLKAIFEDLRLANSHCSNTFLKFCNVLLCLIKRYKTQPVYVFFERRFWLTQLQSWPVCIVIWRFPLRLVKNYKNFTLKLTMQRFKLRIKPCCCSHCVFQTEEHKRTLKGNFTTKAKFWPFSMKKCTSATNSLFCAISFVHREVTSLLRTPWNISSHKASIYYVRSWPYNRSKLRC